MEQFKIESTEVGPCGTRILRLAGPFTLKDVFEFQALVRSGDHPVTIIDLTAVPYMDSASLGSIMGVHASSQRQQRRYALVGVCDRIRTLFQVAGVDKMLTCYASVSDAQTALARHAATQ